MEQWRVCFVAVLGGGVCLCTESIFFVLFFFPTPPKKELFGEKGLAGLLLTDGDDKKRGISVSSPAGALSHSVGAKWVMWQRPNEGRSAAPVICCQIPAERISTV